MPIFRLLSFSALASALLLSSCVEHAPTTVVNQHDNAATPQQSEESTPTPKANDHEVVVLLSSSDPLKLGKVLSKMRETENLPPSAIPRLVELLGDDRHGMEFLVLVPVPAPTVAELAGNVLEQYGASAVPFIEPLLNSDDVDELLLVLRVVRGIGHDANRLEKALANLAKSCDAEVVKCAAISAMVSVSTDSLKSSKQMLHWLDHESPTVRGIATYEIGNLGVSNEDVVQKVVTLLDDEEMRPFSYAPDARGYRAVKWDAVCALGKIANGNDEIRNMLVIMEQESTRKFEKTIIQKAIETMAENAR